MEERSAKLSPPLYDPPAALPVRAFPSYAVPLARHDSYLSPVDILVKAPLPAHRSLF